MRNSIGRGKDLWKKIVVLCRGLVFGKPKIFFRTTWFSHVYPFGRKKIIYYFKSFSRELAKSLQHRSFEIQHFWCSSNARTDIGCDATEFYFLHSLLMFPMVHDCSKALSIHNQLLFAATVSVSQTHYFRNLIFYAISCNTAHVLKKNIDDENSIHFIRRQEF